MRIVIAGFQYSSTPIERRVALSAPHLIAATDFEDPRGAHWARFGFGRHASRVVYRQQIRFYAFAAGFKWAILTAYKPSVACIDIFATNKANG